MPALHELSDYRQTAILGSVRERCTPSEVHLIDGERSLDKLPNDG